MSDTQWGEVTVRGLPHTVCTGIDKKGFIYLSGLFDGLLPFHKPPPSGRPTYDPSPPYDAYSPDLVVFSDGTVLECKYEDDDIRILSLFEGSQNILLRYGIC